MNRTQLIEILEENNVDIPASANVATLRRIYQENIVQAEVALVHSESENGENVLFLENQSDHQSRESSPNRLDIPVNEDLDVELNRLRKLTEIAQLKEELRRLEENDQDMSNNNRRRIEFSDIDYSLQRFNGDDNYRITKWVNDFEEILASGRVDERDKLIFARRMMDGTARKFLTTIQAQNWISLKEQLIDEFDRCRTRQDVYAELNRRKIRKGETTRRYIIEMQSIASHADITEYEVVQFILDGLGELGPGGSMLYSARTMAELKDALQHYERRCNRFAHIPSLDVPSRTILSNIKTGYRSNNSRQPIESNRCQNCRTIGHHESKCPKPRRPPGGCFHCWETGHWYKDCPKKRRNIVATVDAVPVCEPPIDSVDNDISEELAALQMVSVSFNIDNIGFDNKSIFALLDTGSPVSFIRKSLVPKELQSKQLIKSTYFGIGNVKISSYGNINCVIKLQSEIRACNVFIVSDDVLPIPVLMGRDFLKKFNIVLQYSTSSSNRKLFSKNFKNNQDNIVSTVCKSSEPIKVKDKSFYFSPNFIENIFFLADCDLTSDFEPVSQIVDQEALSAKLFDELPYAMIVDCLGDEIAADCGQLFGPEYAKKCFEVLKKNYLKAKRPIESLVHHTMKIHLTSEVPFYCSPRRLSYQEKEEVSKVVDDLLSQQIIRPSNSPYASPIVLVRKKNGEIRMCIDYRSLNKITVRDNFPLPLIDDCLEYLDGKQCFSILDLKNGFHQIPMDANSIPYTSFVTPQGQYEYVKMPFGLRNGPAVFQRFISTVLDDMIRSREIVVYMDDIVVATVTPDEHIQILSKLFRRLVENKLEIKLTKCHFMQTSINYLGYLADKKGIRPNDSHIYTLRNYPMPTNIRELQSCLGLFSYFRRFVPSFSRIAGPLLDLLKKKADFRFDAECSKAFISLRDALVSAPVLAIYNSKRETELHTDASSHGFGAVLLQKQDDNKWHPVSYYSRRTTPAESKYHSFELETLAVIYALRRFRVYVEGLPIRIYTDCHSLTQTLSRKSLNPRIARWALELENYEYSIVHRKGARMGHVDALSRLVTSESRTQCVSDSQICFVQDDDLDFYLHATQSRDPILTGIRDQLQEHEADPFEMHNGLVYRRMKQGHLALYVPAEMETAVIRLLHEKIGHLSTDKCYDQIRLHYWFPSMRRKIQGYIENCIHCIIHNPPRHINERTLHSIPKEPVPFDTIHIDHFGPLPNILNKNKYILVIIDAFTKFVKLYPTNTTSTKEVCFTLDKYFAYYSRPRRLVTDRGTAFMSNDFVNYLSENNILHVKNAVASPQANGQVERVNRVISRILSKITEPIKQANWSQLLTKVEYSVNNSVHSSTKQTPSMLLFGIRQRGPETDELTEYLDEQRTKELPRNLDTFRSEADASICQSQEKNEIQYAGRSFPPRNYVEGDYVVIRNVDTSVGKSKKLIPKYRGPYVIRRVLPNDRYLVGDTDNCQITQIPYRGVLEAARIKPWVKMEVVNQQNT